MSSSETVDWQQERFITLERWKRKKAAMEKKKMVEQAGQSVYKFMADGEVSIRLSRECVLLSLFTSASYTYLHKGMDKWGTHEYTVL